MAANDERTALKSNVKSADYSYASSHPKQARGSSFGALKSSSFDSVEGLTPTGYEVNPIQLLMIGCWLIVGILPNLSALIVGFERDDITCNNYTNYGLLHPRTYLKITGTVGLLVCIACTVGFFCLYTRFSEVIETIVNGRIFEFTHPNYLHEAFASYNAISKQLLICSKIFVMVLIVAAFAWCVVGWHIVTKLNQNNHCSHELVTQTILAWTILQMLLLICALSSRLVKRSHMIYSEADIDVQGQEEGSVHHDHKV
mmetsp:Transcript_5282/g.8692  ORF Transcript_5282/g.8692 Transcript_5282/m.8692 type:complete len:257 (+) Transcript_5282:17-787(+)